MENIASVIIADSQFLITESLRHLLREDSRFSVRSIVMEKRELQRELSAGETTLLIIDPSFTEISSLNELKEIREIYPSLKVLVMTNGLNRNELFELNGLGVTNIVLKSAGKEEILEALSATLRGKKYYSGELLELLFDANDRKNIHEEPGQLTNSEMEIVRLIAEGLTTKEIASRKFISFHTVMTHRKNIFRKLGVSSVSELLMYAIKAGWINLIEYNI